MSKRNEEVERARLAIMEAARKANTKSQDLFVIALCQSIAVAININTKEADQSTVDDNCRIINECIFNYTMMLRNRDRKIRN